MVRGPTPITTKLTTIITADYSVILFSFYILGPLDERLGPLLLTVGLMASVFIMGLLALGSLGFWLGLLMNHTTSAVNATFAAGLMLTVVTLYSCAPGYRLTMGVLVVEGAALLLASQYGIYHYLRKHRDGTHLGRRLSGAVG